MQLDPQERGQLILAMRGAFSLARLNQLIVESLGLDAEDFAPPVARDKREAVSKLVTQLDREGRTDFLLETLRTSEWKDAPSLRPALDKLLARAQEEVRASWGEDEDPFMSSFIPPEGRPFIGRDGLRKHLKRVARGRGKRVIVISGTRPCGKSWSWWYLRYVASGRFAATKLDLSEYSNPSPYELMRDLAFDLGMPEPPEDTVAKGSTQARALAKWFNGRLRQADKRVLVAIDSLDHRRLLKDTEELIVRLAQVAAESDTQAGLTLLLLGPRFELQTVDPFALGEEQICALTRDDVGAFLKDVGDRIGKPLTPTQVEAVLAASFDDPSEDPAEALEQVSVTVANFAEAFFGDASGDAVAAP
jgi:hypothetical protein